MRPVSGTPAEPEFAPSGCGQRWGREAGSEAAGRGGNPGTCKDEGAPMSVPRYARRQGHAPSARETGDLFGGAVPVPHSALGETGGGELAKFQWLLHTIKGSSPRTTS